MVLHKHGDYLYENVKSTVREHLTKVAKVRWRRAGSARRAAADGVGRR